MFETQTAQTRADESYRCRDRSWLSIEDAKRFGVANPVTTGEYKEGMGSLEPEAAIAHFEGLRSISYHHPRQGLAAALSLLN